MSGKKQETWDFAFSNGDLLRVHKGTVHCGSFATAPRSRLKTWSYCATLSHPCGELFNVLVTKGQLDWLRHYGQSHGVTATTLLPLSAMGAE